MNRLRAARVQPARIAVAARMNEEGSGTEAETKLMVTSPLTELTPLEAELMVKASAMNEPPPPPPPLLPPPPPE